MNVPDKGQSLFLDIPDYNICTAGVEKQLSSLNPIKARRPDNLPPRHLKSIAQELAPAHAFMEHHGVQPTGSVDNEPEPSRCVQC